MTQWYGLKKEITKTRLEMNNKFWFLAIFLAFHACENDLAEVKKLISQDEVAIETARGIEILYSDSAVVKVRIKSPTLLRYLDRREPRQEFPDGLTVEFFGGLNQVSSRMTAKYAVRYENQNKIIIRDSVVWESNKNERLETEELIWDETEDKVYSNRPVTIRRKDEIIYGYGFESNQDFTSWKIKATEGRFKANNLKKGFKD